MAKYGKWIGAGLGLALGGPLGALFGLFIGSMFDNIQTIAIPSDGGPIPPGQTGRGDFTFSLTVLATAVMKADGRIMRSELDYVKTFLIRNFGIEATREAMQMIKELSTRDIPVDDVCQQILKLLKYNCSISCSVLPKQTAPSVRPRSVCSKIFPTGWASIMSLSCP